MIDGHAIVFRAYYAFPPSLTTPEGEQINAVYGFASILLTVLRELKPTHAAVAFDLDKPTFRHIDYADYKAQRPEVDQELKDQLNRVREVVRILNIPIFEVEGFEADDVIGTLGTQAVRSKQGGVGVIIVTGDQDAMQLVNGQVKVYVPQRGKKPAKIYGEKEVIERYGLHPDQIVDYKALVGDVSDNIPGVKGVGPKTAVQLLKEFGTVERLYRNDKLALESLASLSKSVVEKLADGYENAIRSKKLAEIVLDVPISLNWKDCKLDDYDKKKAVELFESLGFRTLIAKLPNDNGEEVKKTPQNPAKAGWRGSKDKNKQIGLF